MSGRVKVTLEGNPSDVRAFARSVGSYHPHATRRASHDEQARRSVTELSNRVELLTGELARMSHALAALVRPSPEDEEAGASRSPADPGPFYDQEGGTHTTRDGARMANERFARGES